MLIDWELVRSSTDNRRTEQQKHTGLSALENDKKTQKIDLPRSFHESGLHAL